MPSSLPLSADFAWTFDLPADTMAGVAATQAYVVCGTRDLIDHSDVFFCLDARTGQQKWKWQYPASPPVGAETRDGKLDFGNAPRATPLICGDRVVTLGAMGDVHCIELETGRILWSWNLLTDFGGKLPTWGYCGSPIAVDQWVILQPGGSDCSLLALRLEDGEPVWETPGRAASYSSFVLGFLGDSRQLIGLDAESIGGWDVDSGQRIWEIKPLRGGEFQVPTPVVIGTRLLVVGENNGARIYELSTKGIPEQVPLAVNEDCNPDTHTPVVLQDMVIALHHSLLVMSADTLVIEQEVAYDDLSHFGSLITDGEHRVLAMTDRGALMLFELHGRQLTLKGTLKLASTRSSHVYSHPAVVGNRLYCVIDGKLNCLELN